MKERIPLPDPSPSPTCIPNCNIKPCPFGNTTDKCCTAPSTVYRINAPTNITTQHYTT